MFFRPIYDPFLLRESYLIGCHGSGEAIVVDPADNVGRYRELASQNGLHIVGVAETGICDSGLTGTREFVSSCEPIIGYLPLFARESQQYEWARNHHKVLYVRNGDSFFIGKVHFSVVLLSQQTPERISFFVTDESSGSGKSSVLLSGDVKSDRIGFENSLPESKAFAKGRFRVVSDLRLVGRA